MDFEYIGSDCEDFVAPESPKNARPEIQETKEQKKARYISEPVLTGGKIARLGLGCSVDTLRAKHKAEAEKRRLTNTLLNKKRKKGSDDEEEQTIGGLVEETRVSSESEGETRSRAVKAKPVAISKVEAMLQAPTPLSKSQKKRLRSKNSKLKGDSAD